MHPMAATAIRKKIKGTLLHTQVEGGRIGYEAFGKHLGSLADEILKKKKEWIDRTDVFHIYLTYVMGALDFPNIGCINVKPNVWDFLGEQRAEMLVEDLTIFFLSIPRKYQVYIPIKNLTGNFKPRLQESDSWGFVYFKDSDSFPTDHTPSQLEIDTVYLCQKIDGYCGTRFDSITARAALNTFKVIMQLGIIEGVFAFDEDINKTSIAEHFHVSKVYIVTADQSASPPSYSCIQLPLDISQYISRLNYTSDKKNGLRLLRFRNPDAIPTAVEDTLRPLCKILSSSSEPLKRIKSSIQWYFDSFTTQSPTLSFLQVCIGLEAILGDDVSSGILTETLADRCSYLIARNIEARKDIKETFKELYTMRSKIVHGCVSELDQEQQVNLLLGRKMLSEAILQEIDHLD